MRRASLLSCANIVTCAGGAPSAIIAPSSERVLILQAVTRTSAVARIVVIN